MTAKEYILALWKNEGSGCEEQHDFIFCTIYWTNLQIFQYELLVKYLPFALGASGCKISFVTGLAASECRDLDSINTLIIYSQIVAPYKSQQLFAETVISCTPQLHWVKTENGFISLFFGCLYSESVCTCQEKPMHFCESVTVSCWSLSSSSSAFSICYNLYFCLELFLK